MLGKTLESLFIKSWVIIKLNLLFWLLSSSGLFIFGIGPALKSVNELFAANEFNDKEITLNGAWRSFKQNFVRGNLLFGTLLIVLSMLSYNLYLSVQIKGLFFLMIDFILVFALMYVLVAFQYSLLLDSVYDISLFNLLKLSLISSFSSFSQLLKIFFGIFVILLITWRYKGLILFGTVSLIQIWSYLVTKKWRVVIDERLEFHV